MNSNEIAAKIQSIQWDIETRLPAEMKKTNHARRIASLRRQQAEGRKELSRLVTELGSTLQEERLA